MKHAIIEKTYVIYCHRNKYNNKVYIGQTCRKYLSQRWGKNGEGYTYNTHFWRAIQKYGWNNFEHIILAKDLSKKEADELEIYYIQKYNSTDSEYGYNKDIGGQHVISEEAKQKMSKSHLGKTPWNKGKHISEETKEKLRQTNIGKRHSEETKKKISKANIGKHSNKGRIPWNKGMCGEYHVEFTESHKQKLSETCKGKNKDRVWINDGKNCKFVKQSELQEYITKNWIIGRIINRRKKLCQNMQ